LDFFRLLLAEVYDSDENTMKYYGEGDQPLADFPFNFLLVNELGSQPTASKLKELVERWMIAMPSGACPNWVVSKKNTYLYFFYCKIK
jgi:alpha-glucosidase